MAITTGLMARARAEVISTRRTPVVRVTTLPRRPVGDRARRWLLDLLALPVAESYLSVGERCLIATRLHCLVPVLAILRAGAMMTAVGVLTVVMPGVFLVQTILWLGALAHTGWVGWCVLLWRTEQIVVTDTRLIRVSGVVTITVDTVPLSEITDSSLRRSVPGRIFGYGTVRIETAGQEHGVERLTFVPSPDDVYRATLH